MSGDSPTVLVTDADPVVVADHAAQLDAEYVVRTASDGREALAELDDTVDVVLFDRRLPGLGSEDVLARVRREGLDCRVVLLAGSDPSFDVLDVGFDDHLTQPVTEEALLGVVERMVRRVRYDRRLDEFFALASEVAALEAHHGSETLDRHAEYETLRARLDEMRAVLDAALESLPARERHTVATGPGVGRDRASN